MILWGNHVLHSLDLFAWGRIKILYVLYHVKQNTGEEKNLMLCPLIPFIVMNYSDTSMIGFVRF